MIGKTKTSFKEIRARDPPAKRNGHHIVSDEEGFIYCFGGYGDYDQVQFVRHLFKDLWRFNPMIRQWQLLKTKGDLPQLTVSCAVIYFRNQILVYGGTGYPLGSKMTNQIFSLNLSTLFWTELVPRNKDCIHVPLPMYAQAMVADGEKNCLYCIGGVTEKGAKYHMDVHRFDLKTRLWTEVYTTKIDTEYKRHKMYHQLVSYKGKIYCFGGGKLPQTEKGGSIAAFDLQSQKWLVIKTKGESPSLQGHKEQKHRICSFGSVIATGHYAYHFRPCCKDVWCLDLDTMFWRSLELPMPRLAFGGVTINPMNKVYVFGGLNWFGMPNNKLYGLNVAVAPLQELAWQALTDRHFKTKRSFTERKRKQLLQYGLPQRFSSRLQMFAFGK